MTTLLGALILPFILQAGATFFDEFYFHHKRGLPLWERLGHPLDTITVLACYSLIITSSPSPQTLKIYLAMVLFSCLFITKDEFVHHEQSSAHENWLHALLFVLHPIVLTILLLYWYGHSLTILTATELQLFQFFIQSQFFLICSFLLYQILYWSFPWKKLFRQKTPSTTTSTTT